ncbi:MAG: transketolase [Oscillospiraceae bacterium]|jgi:transketolase|nr:transketolase [Oscillospiraceae bacterium]MBQ5342687.1 transketolase [Oscillospiraceae bacterium]MBR4827978.1 transketolase [Oscillospiraceae bacterium]
MDIKELKEVCRQVRRDIIIEVADAASGHPGGSLSAVEMLVALYFKVMNIDPKEPQKADRDRFVLSKGHAAPGLYAVLAERGYFDKEELHTLRKLGSKLQGHPDPKKLPGIDAATGSLGQGISIAVGMALGAKLAKNGAKVYTMVGDGEMQEGMVWEAAMAAANYKLDNFTVFVDNNGLQISGKNDDVMALGDIAAKFRAFGFDVIEVEDGNDIEQVLAAIDVPFTPGKPKCILAHTVKGKGVSFMENNVGWHGTAPKPDQRDAALKELEG